MTFVVHCEGGARPRWSISQYFDSQEEAFAAKELYEEAVRHRVVRTPERTAECTHEQEEAGGGAAVEQETRTMTASDEAFTAEYKPETDLDLGSEHWLCWYSGRGPRGEIERVGATVWHRKADGHLCAGGVVWDTDYLEQLRIDGSSYRPSPWQIAGAPDEHLTLAPSVLCLTCGDHGFIRDGKWIPA